MSEVIIVTNPELGWDCIVAVFKADDVSKESLEKVFQSDEYVIHYPREVHKDTGEFRDRD